MVDRSKARSAKRDAAVERDGAGRTPGRPPGARPLKEDDRRFEIAMFGMLVRTRLSKPGELIRAATFAAVVFNKGVRVTASERGVGLSFHYTRGRGAVVTTMARGRRHNPKDRDEALKNRRDKILREAPALIAGATGDDAIWLEQSMLALHAAFNALGIGHALMLRTAIGVLASERLGWSDPIRKLFPI
jgi:hypothetical protein